MSSVSASNEEHSLQPQEPPPPASATATDCAGNLTQTKNERLVEKKFCMENYNRKTAKLRDLALPTCTLQKKGATDTILLHDMLDAVDLIYESFPDHRFGWDSVDEIEPGIVVIRNYYGYGHHTGKPFAFGPFPPIPATGIYVQEDPCNMICHLNEKNQLYKLVIDMDNVHDSITGPPGYYMSIGGDMNTNKTTTMLRKESRRSVGRQQKSQKELLLSSKQNPQQGGGEQEEGEEEEKAKVVEEEEADAEVEKKAVKIVIDDERCQ